MAESSGDGAAPSMSSQKKRKLEGEPGEGEGPVEELVKPLILSDPDLQISGGFTSFRSIDSSFKQVLPPSDPVERGKPTICFRLRSSPFTSIDPEKRDRKDDHFDCDDDGGRATMAKSWLPKPAYELRHGEPGREDLQGEKDPSLCGPFIDVPDPDMEGSKSGSKPQRGEPECLQGGKDPSLCVPFPQDPDVEGSKSSTQASDSISGGQLLPLEKEEEKHDYTAEVGEEGEDWTIKMTEEEVGEWFDWWIKQDLDSEVLRKSPGWGYSDVDEDDPDWHDKFREKFRRETPPKYKAARELAYCPPGVFKKDEALWERYLKQIEESEGYDITDFPGSTLATPITPLLGFKQSPTYVKAIGEVTDAAINWFNGTSNDDDQYEVHDILTVNVSSRGCRSRLYYITFEAKKKNNIVSSAEVENDDHRGASLLTTFQARVFSDFEKNVDVEQCRIKSPKTSPA